MQICGIWSKVTQSGAFAETVRSPCTRAGYTRILSYSSSMIQNEQVLGHVQRAPTLVLRESSNKKGKGKREKRKRERTKENYNWWERKKWLGMNVVGGRSSKSASKPEESLTARLVRSPKTAMRRFLVVKSEETLCLFDIF